MKLLYLSGFLFFIFNLQTQAATLAISVKDSGGNPLADSVVYLDTANPPSTTQSNEVQIEQKGKEFHPFVSVTLVNSTVYFPNRDGIGHHVYSFSPAKTFQLPLSEQEITNSVTFDAPGIVTVGCNIHDWMVGYIYVVNSPYHAVTDKDGTSILDNVPPGSYILHAWHPGIKTGTDMQQQLVINGDVAGQYDFIIDIRPQYFWKPVRPAENEEVEY